MKQRIYLGLLACSAFLVTFEAISMESILGPQAPGPHAGGAQGARPPAPAQQPAAASVGQDEQSDNCSVCLESLEEPGLSVTLSCMHTFHLGCIAACIDRKCPNCRRPEAILNPYSGGGFAQRDLTDEEIAQFGILPITAEERRFLNTISQRAIKVAAPPVEFVRRVAPAVAAPQANPQPPQPAAPPVPQASRPAPQPSPQPVAVQLNPAPRNPVPVGVSPLASIGLRQRWFSLRWTTHLTEFLHEINNASFREWVNEKRASDGNTLCHILVKIPGRPTYQVAELFDRLVRHGANLDIPNNAGETVRRLLQQPDRNELLLLSINYISIAEYRAQRVIQAGESYLAWDADEIHRQLQIRWGEMRAGRMGNAEFIDWFDNLQAQFAQWVDFVNYPSQYDHRHRNTILHYVVLEPGVPSDTTLLFFERLIQSGARTNIQNLHGLTVAQIIEHDPDKALFKAISQHQRAQDLIDRRAREQNPPALAAPAQPAAPQLAQPLLVSVPSAPAGAASNLGGAGRRMPPRVQAAAVAQVQPQPPMPPSPPDSWLSRNKYLVMTGGAAIIAFLSYRHWSKEEKKEEQRPRRFDRV
jgi:hypothetical protein